jgi:hypothetical protein
MIDRINAVTKKKQTFATEFELQYVSTRRDLIRKKLRYPRTIVGLASSGSPACHASLFLAEASERLGPTSQPYPPKFIFLNAILCSSRPCRLQ